MLVLHGGLGLDHTYLRPWLDPLSEHLQLIYYDHRGNGRSPEPRDWGVIDHQSWIADADRLRAALGHERILLFGHSYGSFLALEYAMRYPERTAGLVLCSTAAALDYPEVVVANARSRGSPELVEAVLGGLTTPVESDEGFERLWFTILPLYFHQTDPEVARSVFSSTRFRVSAFNRSNFHCAPSYDLLQRLPEIVAPTLILTGRHDWITPPAYGGDRVARGIPNAEHVVFERSGHFPFVEEPALFCAVVEEWLRGPISLLTR